MKKKETFSTIVGVAVILAFIYMAVLGSGIIGVSKNKIEKDARASQHIAEDDLVAKDVTEDLAALLFYDEEKQKHTFSLYVNRDGFSFGYFFVYGGSLCIYDEAIKGINKGEKGMALLSMNLKQVARIVVDGESREVDSSKPFAVIVPARAGEIRLFDSNGNELAIDQMEGA